MGKIVLMLGPSCSGKDTLYQEVKTFSQFKFKDIILHTTRPMRQNEVNGREYYFCNEEEMNYLEKEGKIIEKRCYNTVLGDWYYFTVGSGFDIEKNNYIGLSTLEGLDLYLKRYSVDDIISLYIFVNNKIRLQRAIEREKGQSLPNYKELCRRFFADCEDFSLENLKKRPITAVIDNNGDLKDSLEQVEKVLKKVL